MKKLQPPKMPEPFVRKQFRDWITNDLFSINQMQSYGDAMQAYGRATALEEAAKQLQQEREAFKQFLRDMHADHNDQHNHFRYALNEWVKRSEQTNSGA